MNIINEISGLVARLQNENIALIHRNEAQAVANEEKLDEVLTDFLQVIDAFEWAEKAIKERGLDQSQVSQKAITRLLTAKSKTLAVLEKYDVKKVELDNRMIDEEKCVIVATERDSNRSNGTIVSIEKDGFERNGKLLRAVEVVVVRN